MSNYQLPAEDRRLKFLGQTGDQITVECDGLEIAIWRSDLEHDRGQPVIQIDGQGMFRVNVNDGPIWNADPDEHTHRQCQCVTDFERREEP